VLEPLAGATSWLGDRLVAGSLQAAVVVSLAWAACRWFPRVPAAVQAWVWWFVALKLALTFVPLPVLDLPLLPFAASGSTPALAVAAPQGTGVSEGLPDALLAQAAAPAAAAATSWVDILAIAWLLGIAAHAAMLVRAATGLHGLVRRATPLGGADLAEVSRMAAALGLTRIPRVCESPEVRVPQVAGWRNPVVLVPAGAAALFTSDEWRMALAHELMHVRRRDVLLGCLPALAERVYFFHPLVRVAAREYVTAREAACDAAVVQALQVPAADYGRVLVRIGTGRSRPVLVASSAPASASCLRRRLDMLQDIPSRTTSRLLTAFVAAAAVLALAPVRLVAIPAQDLPALPAVPALPAPPAARPAPLPPLAPLAVAPATPAPPALPATPPAPPAPPARPGTRAAALPPAPPQPPALPAPPGTLHPVAPPLPAAPAAPAPPQAPPPPPPPRSDEVVLRLKSPATESEAVENALRVLQTQLRQIEEQTAAASRQLSAEDRDVLAQTRRKLEELVLVMQNQARGAQTTQQRAMQLSMQMANLNRQREQLVEQQKALDAQIRLMNAEFERLKIERKVEEAKKRF
jgi:bla regulator protein blaR1